MVPVILPPLLIRSPFKVNKKVDKSSFPPLFTVNGTELLNVLAEFRVTFWVVLITTPPEAANGITHSSEVTVLAFVVLYSNVALGP